MQVKDQTLFAATPGNGTMVRSYSLYTHRTGVRKMRVDTALTRDENLLSFTRYFSDDNGHTWSAPESLLVKEPVAGGVRRWHVLPGFVDPANERLVTMLIEGVLPLDDPVAALRHWVLRYRVSLDGGRSTAIDEQVIQQGPYTAEHPLEGVWTDKNAMMTCDFCCSPIRTRGGRLLVPVCGNVLGPDGELYNPAGALCFMDAAVLIGHWTDDGRIIWEMSQRVSNDPARSSRGCLEPTIAQMPDGRILMILRGSNETILEQPGVKWYSISSDEGTTWTPPQPWTDTDGVLCYSPSSCSQLLQHSNGHYYWLGNLTPENPQGSYPRYPLFIGRVDADSFRLVRESLVVIETSRPGEELPVMLSSFMAHEDRESGDILVHLSRAFPDAASGFWTANAYLYRIEA